MDVLAECYLEIISKYVRRRLLSILLRLLSMLSISECALAGRLFNQGDAYVGRPVVLSVLEQPALSHRWRFKQPATQVIPEGGYAMFIIRVPDRTRCEPIQTYWDGARAWVMLPVELDQGSDEEALAGRYYDALLPVNSESCQVSGLRLLEWKPNKEGNYTARIDGQSLKFNITFKGVFTGSHQSFYVGLNPSSLLKGHCRIYCKKEVELTQKYQRLLRDHHITPIQSWIRFPPVVDGRLNLNAFWDKGYSFNQVTPEVNDEMQKVIFPRYSHYPDAIGYLKALEVTISETYLQGRAWVYVDDEPSDFPALIEELKLYRQYAPSVKTMVTTAYRADLAPWVDIFSPQLSLWHANEQGYTGKEVWPYPSCMRSCGPNRLYKPNAVKSPGPAAHVTDLLIDRSYKQLASFFESVAQTNSEGGLYYHAVEGYPLMRNHIDLFKDPWNFGGNGDGLLVYPGVPGRFGLTEHEALPSLRLKFIRHAIEQYW